MARRLLRYLAALALLQLAATLQPSTTLAPHTPTHPDYVIVGGGPAGFVMAEQLSRNSNKSVILLEAGTANAGVKNIDVPGYAPNLLNTIYTWNYTSQPDPNLQGNAPSLAQGRGFGGGTAVNYLGLCRGAPSVFDEWAKIAKDPGLRWENFYNDFKATVHFVDQDVGYDTHINISAYGEGPIELTAPDDNLGFVLQLIQAWQSVLGLPWVDLNDGTGLGVATSTDDIRANNRTRDFASQAYGWQMAARPNAQQLYDAQVVKIGFKGTRAVNVTYISSNGTSHTLRPKEIILAAGALNTPKLLMLSGVGPAADLKSLGIRVIADIPHIGRNLYDHHYSYMEFEVGPEIQTLWQYTENATFAAIAEEEYTENASGPLSVPNGAAFAVSRIPDWAFDGVNATFQTSLPADRGQLLYQYSSSTFQATTPNVSIISPFVALVQPEASGHMRLASANYCDDPLIYSNYYGSAGDKAAILYGYKQLRNVVSDPAFAPLLVREVFPGANVTSDEDLWKAISESASTFHHPMGTVALGTVVEGGTYRIKGLHGIRVVDTSTFPNPPTCHPMATIYAYAYHAAQLIKAQDI